MEKALENRRARFFCAVVNDVTLMNTPRITDRSSSRMILVANREAPREPTKAFKEEPRLTPPCSPPSLLAPPRPPRRPRAHLPKYPSFLHTLAIIIQTLVTSATMRENALWRGVIGDAVGLFFGKFLGKYEAEENLGRYEEVKKMFLDVKFFVFPSLLEAIETLQNFIL